ncbi:MAG: hypothetical protein M3Y37_00785, partial [Chloroflexota bacterium]|nr:hypothetical protein [Chloroflexota bacterium]
MTTSVPASAVHSSFGEWAFTAGQNGLHPLVLVVGTRGKSTVARLLDSIASSAGLRTALRTDAGVEIEGKRQLGDIHPLSEALDELDQGQIDLAIVEMAWGDLNTLPLGDRKPGGVIVSTICPHKDYCLLDDTRRAITSLKHMLVGTPPSTLITADIDDSAFPSLNDVDFDNLILTTASDEHPTLQRYLGDGGLAVWTGDDHLVVGSLGRMHLRLPIEMIPITMHGTALFQMRNLMLAAGMAIGMGISPADVERGLLGVQPTNAWLPTSLNSFTASGVRVLIDRPSPSWFLGPLLRATRAMKAPRQ